MLWITAALTLRTVVSIAPVPVVDTTGLAALMLVLTTIGPTWPAGAWLMCKPVILTGNTDAGKAKFTRKRTEPPVIVPVVSKFVVMRIWAVPVALKLGGEVTTLAINGDTSFELTVHEKDLNKAVATYGDYDRITESDFAEAIGLTMDGSKFGMGKRSQRYSMIVDDGVVEQLNVEAPGEYRASSAETMLDQLATA